MQRDGGHPLKATGCPERTSGGPWTHFPGSFPMKEGLELGGSLWPVVVRKDSRHVFNTMRVFRACCMSPLQAPRIDGSIAGFSAIAVLRVQSISLALRPLIWSFPQKSHPVDASAMAIKATASRPSLRTSSVSSLNNSSITALKNP
eukprot:448113-Prymnesium_polylepis.1